MLFQILKIKNHVAITSGSVGDYRGVTSKSILFWLLCGLRLLSLWQCLVSKVTGINLRHHKG